VIQMPRLHASKTSVALAGACVAATALASAAVADTPPPAGHEIKVFPARDSVVGRGYAADLPAVVSVLRYDAEAAAFAVVSRSEPILPQDDPDTPGFDGIVGVNLADGGCWRRVTPDIAAGDRVRIVQRDSAGAVLTNDSTITGSVTAAAPSLSVADFAPIAFGANRTRTRHVPGWARPAQRSSSMANSSAPSSVAAGTRWPPVGANWIQAREMWPGRTGMRLCVSTSCAADGLAERASEASWNSGGNDNAHTGRR